MRVDTAEYFDKLRRSGLGVYRSMVQGFRAY